MSEDKLVPCIRFKGFVGEWENRSFKDIVTINSGKDYKHLSKGDIPVYGTGGLMLYVNDKLSEKDAIGIGRKGTIDRPQFLKAPFWTVDTLFFMVPKKKFNIYFVYCLSEKTNWKKYDESTGLPSLSKSTISKISSFTPPLKEQQKIGDLFAKLDRLLDLQQQKLDQLELLKKALLQKLFPKQGAKIPELRFKGFEEEWYKDKAINSFKSVSDKHHPNLPILAASQAKGMILRNDLGIDIKYKKSSLDSYKKVQPNQFVIHLMSFEGGIAYSKYKGITSPAYTVLAIREKNNQDPIFWKYSFTRENFIRKLKVISYGVRMGKSISYIDFGKLTLSFPTLTEQQKIGNLLEKVDRLLELENKKSNNLKKVKKFLLQNMFVE